MAATLYVVVHWSFCGTPNSGSRKVGVGLFQTHLPILETLLFLLSFLVILSLVMLNLVTIPGRPAIFSREIEEEWIWRRRELGEEVLGKVV